MLIFKIKAKLIIETDELMWSYEIKGLFPNYRPPIVDQTRIENKLNSEVENKLLHKRKNFLAYNIKQSKAIMAATMYSTGTGTHSWRILQSDEKVQKKPKEIKRNFSEKKA